ncbi:MAG: hypothetical protein ACQETI_13560 [Halobacteriota archaeon]
MDPEFSATFDEPIETVARDHQVDQTELRTLVARHQDLVADLPGVEDIVYEWRKTLPRNPLVERRRAAYYLLVDERIWREYARALSFEGEELTAVEAVHRLTLRRVAADRLDDDRKPMVLLRS